MDLSNLENILKKEPGFRKKQAEEMVFKHLIDNWKDATNLPLTLIDALNKACPLEIDAEIFPSRTGDVSKSLITLSDDIKIESVLMRHNDKRNTVCVSSQAGCPLGCAFCATGKMGFKRNLLSMEIVEQVLLFARYLKKENERVDNIVFMGMGEPFLNYDNVMAAIKIINGKNGLNIGARHISISTVGIAEGIGKLAEEQLQVNLAISLHAPNDEARNKIVPANKKYPIGDIMKAVADYAAKTKRRVMFEYIMIKDVNDFDAMAEELAALLRQLPKHLYFVNLISYNPTGIFNSSSPQRIKSFKNILEDKSVAVTERYRFGQDVDAACGQLGRRKEKFSAGR